MSRRQHSSFLDGALIHARPEERLHFGHVLRVGNGKRRAQSVDEEAFDVPFDVEERVDVVPTLRDADLIYISFQGACSFLSLIICVFYIHTCLSRETCGVNHPFLSHANCLSRFFSAGSSVIGISSARYLASPTFLRFVVVFVLNVQLVTLLIHFSPTILRFVVVSVINVQLVTCSSIYLSLAKLLTDSPAFILTSLSFQLSDFLLHDI